MTDQPTIQRLTALLDEAENERSRDMPVEQVIAEARADGRDLETLVARMRERVRQMQKEGDRRDD